MDCCKKYHNESIVKLEPNMGLICLIMNIVGPGYGTAIAGFITGGEAVKTGLITMLIMWLCCGICMAGYIWSIYHGWKIY